MVKWYTMENELEITERQKPRIKWYRSPLDRESLKAFLKVLLIGFVVDPIGLMQQAGWCNGWGYIFRLSCGQFKGEWELALYPASDLTKRRPVIWWSRTLLIGHGTLLGISIYYGFWLLPVLVSFAPYYGRWLMFLCNVAQFLLEKKYDQ